MIIFGYICLYISNYLDKNNKHFITYIILLYFKGYYLANEFKLKILGNFPLLSILNLYLIIQFRGSIYVYSISTNNLFI